MPRFLSFVFAAATVLGAVAFAAPMSSKELEFLVRMGTPEADILRDLGARRLLEPLDPAGEQRLAAIGAGAGLLQKIKSGAYTLTPEEAQAESVRQTAQQQAAMRQFAEDAAFSQEHARRRAQSAMPAMPARQGGVQAWLSDRLFLHEGGNLRPFDRTKISGTRVFALYGSASWCGPCRKFTPQLVAAYPALKNKYPEFEVVFVSNDRSDSNMAEYMGSHSMPWPAVKPGQLPPEMERFFGGSIPWLVVVSADGRPLTKNGIDRKYIDPTAVLGSLDGLLAKHRAGGL